jgi:hypothetical protein
MVKHENLPHERVFTIPTLNLPQYEEDEYTDVDVDVDGETEEFGFESTRN